MFSASRQLVYDILSAVIYVVLTCNASGIIAGLISIELIGYFMCMYLYIYMCVCVCNDYIYNRIWIR